jgi:hypothetical protein
MTEGTLASDRQSVLERANRRMNRLIFFTTGLMFAYGILLPAQWQDLFGIFAWPIQFAAQSAPATVKVSELSPIPDLVNGFFGLGSWVVIAFTLILVSRDPIGERIRFAFSRSGKSPLKTFGFIYLLGVPTCLLGLWVAFFMPISIDMTGGVTWGSKLLVSMITSRLALAILGAIAVTGLGMLVYILVVAILGPIVMVFQGDKLWK